MASARRRARSRSTLSRGGWESVRDRADFTDHGLCIQRRYVPHAEPNRGERRFLLALATGEQLEARAVVLAIGLGHFRHVPEELSRLPHELLSHSFGSYAFQRFAGQEVAVVGAGQSALECAVPLHEAGARPVLLARSPPVFHGRTPVHRPLLERLREPLSVLGAGRMNWLLGKFPWLPHHAPEDRRVRLARTFLGPPVPGGCAIDSRGRSACARPSRSSLPASREAGSRSSLGRGDAARGAIRSPGRRDGLKHDVRRLEFLAPALAAQLELIQERAPRLSSTFQASVPGPYVVEPFSAYAFGPLFRFICGATYAAPVVARHLASRGVRTRARSRGVGMAQSLRRGRRAA